MSTSTAIESHHLAEDLEAFRERLRRLTAADQDAALARANALAYWQANPGNAKAEETFLRAAEAATVARNTLNSIYQPPTP